MGDANLKRKSQPGGTVAYVRGRVVDTGKDIDVVDAESERRGEGRTEHVLWDGGGSFASPSSDDSFWSDAEWITGADGKARRVKSGVRLLAHGIPARVAKLRALGNAIVPQVAAEVIAAYMDLIEN